MAWPRALNVPPVWLAVIAIVVRCGAATRSFLPRLDRPGGLQTIDPAVN
jgi:hypothetical protein